ncbi:fibronectin type III domain-containing protein, partial [Acerihabitans arboris]
TPGTTYRFYIVSEGLDGQFGLNASNEITPTTAALARPPSPVNLRTTAVAAGSVTLQWDYGTDGTEPVSYFSLYQNGAFLTNITGYTLTLSTLTPGLLYDFFIISVAANGQTSATSSNTLEVIIGTAPALPPAAPLSASYQFVNATTAQLNIIPGGGGGVVNGFAALELNSQAWFFSPGANASIRVDYLIPGQSYYFLVFAVGRDGQRSAGYAQASFTQPQGVISSPDYPNPAPGDIQQPDGYPALPFNPQHQAHGYDGYGPVQYPW